MTMIQQVTQSFARRLVVEKAYQVLARFDEFGAVVASGEQKAFLDSVDVAELPELQGLLDIFDLVLVKGDGIGFMIVALVKQGRLKISQREALIEQAKACLKYTGKKAGGPRKGKEAEYSEDIARMRALKGED